MSKIAFFVGETWGEMVERGLILDDVEKIYRQGFTDGARDAYERRREQDVWVYFAELPNGSIKIGATVNVRQRMSQLQGRCLASCRGGFQREKAEHRRFAHLRIEGEREKYRAEPELLKYAASIEADPRRWTRATTANDLASHYRLQAPASEDTKLLVEFMNALAEQI